MACKYVQVFKIAYCQPVLLSRYDEYKQTCEEFVQTIHEHFPEFKSKVKIHLILHLPDNMIAPHQLLALRGELHLTAISTPFSRVDRCCLMQMQNI